MDIKVEDINFDLINKRCELVFISKPDRSSMEYAPELLKMKKRVIDLGGDFRFKNYKIFEIKYRRMLVVQRPNHHLSLQNQRI